MGAPTGAAKNVMLFAIALYCLQRALLYYATRKAVALHGHAHSE